MKKIIASMAFALLLASASYAQTGTPGRDTVSQGTMRKDTMQSLKMMKKPMQKPMRRKVDTTGNKDTV